MHSCIKWQSENQICKDLCDAQDPDFTGQQWQCKAQINSVLLILDNVCYLNAEFK